MYRNKNSKNIFIISCQMIQWPLTCYRELFDIIFSRLHFTYLFTVQYCSLNIIYIKSRQLIGTTVFSHISLDRTFFAFFSCFEAARSIINWTKYLLDACVVIVIELLTSPFVNCVDSSAFTTMTSSRLILFCVCTSSFVSFLFGLDFSFFFYKYKFTSQIISHNAVFL